jgi:hypothetical protein
MTQNQFHKLFLFLALLAIMVACSPAQPQVEQTPPPAPSAEPTSEPAGMGMPVPTSDGEPVSTPTEMIAIDSITHTDETFAYTFDYPSTWMLDAIVFGSRAPGGYQLSSWLHEPGMVSEIPVDGTIMDILIQLWDPKADLAAFVEQRKTAWDASGIEIVSEEDVTLSNGQPAKEFIVMGGDGAASYNLFSILGENYLVAGGSGDIELIRQIARSLR